MEVMIITGMSGAGKTKAVDWFEDQKYYCIDNMPPTLIKNFIDLSISSKKVEKAAFVADIRSGTFFAEIENIVDELKKMNNIDVKVLFLEAAVPTIVRRYNETRRNHPLTGGKATADVIRLEKEKLEGMKERADYIIDTTGLKVSDFHSEMENVIKGNKGMMPFNVNISSFGYKYGIPMETDITFDLRFIPNPYYVKSLRKLTGNNNKVSAYVFRHEIAEEFVKQFFDLMNMLIPGYIKEGKHHINIAFGCTGGHHRSVAVANRVAEIFRQDGKLVTVNHRDLDFLNRNKG